MAEMGVSPQVLLQWLLNSERELTAVDLFSRRHDEGLAAAPSGRYRDLIPLSAPAAHQQYAFEVDLDRCSGCKACVTACHSMNGLDDQESWRSVGLLSGHATHGSRTHTITSSCHHCADPGCLTGCPVLAYEKDSATGIVRHLDDQCIGCQYCIWKCPYDAPKYNPSRGIVRKCDMCSSRLASGEAPACVQACPTQAIRITLVERPGATSKPGRRTAPELLPGMAPSNLTLPTTRYVSRQPIREIPLPAPVIRPEPANASLILMLLLTQWSVGLFAAGLTMPGSATSDWTLNWVAVILGFSGIMASVFHLGRPWMAWKAFLGIRRSWLSREIIAFSCFAALSIPAALFPESWMHGAAVVIGILSVFSSVMIYHNTGRPFWNGRLTAFRFFGSVLIAATVACGIASGSRGFFTAAAFLITGKAALELLAFRGPDRELLRNSMDLLTGPLKRLFAARMGLAAGAAFLLLLGPSGPVRVAAIILILAGEWCERQSFFQAVVPYRIPGASS